MTKRSPKRSPQPQSNGKTKRSTPSFDDNRQRSQSPIKKVEQVQQQKLEETLNQVLSNTPALSVASLPIGKDTDTSEKLFRCLDTNNDGYLTQSEIWLFAQATGFDEDEMSWDETYGELCAEYECNPKKGLSLDDFRGLCNAYLAHDCYEESIMQLMNNLELENNNELENFSLNAMVSNSRKSSQDGNRSIRGSANGVASPKTEKKVEESKEVRKLRKKVREIEEIEDKINSGKKVDKLQRDKVTNKDQLLTELQKALFQDGKDPRTSRNSAANLVESSHQQPSYRAVEKKRRESSLVDNHDSSPRKSANNGELNGEAADFVPAKDQTVESNWRNQMGTGDFEWDQQCSEHNQAVADAWRSGGYQALSAYGMAPMTSGVPYYYGGSNNWSSWGHDNQAWRQQKQAYNKNVKGETPKNADKAGDQSPSALFKANFY